jgi:hypothetical protein
MGVIYGEYANLKIKVTSYKSSNQNCLIAVFKRPSNSPIKYEIARKQLNIKPKDAIDVAELPRIADLFNCGYILYNNLSDKLEVIGSHETDRDLVVELIIVNGHAHHIINMPTELRTHAFKTIQFGMKKPNIPEHINGFKKIVDEASLEEIQALVD